MNLTSTLINQNRTAKLVAVLVGGSMYGLMVVHQTMNAQPEFYAAKLDQTEATLVEHARALQTQLNSLANPEHTETNWCATITEDQINGWLMAELPERFPEVLANGMRDPRVVIEPDRLRIACQYRSGNMEAVLTLETEAFLTNRPNEIGFRILDTRIGSVAGLTEEALRPITNACYRARVRMRWLRRGEHPEAIVTIPPALLHSRHKFNFQSIDLAEGQLNVALRLLPEPPRPTVKNSIRPRRGVVVVDKFPRASRVVTQRTMTAEPGAKHLELPKPVALSGP